MKSRRLEFKFRPYWYSRTIYPSGPSYFFGGYFDTSSFHGTQVTESINHPSWKKRRTGDFSQGDVGGPFFTQKSYVVGRIATGSASNDPKQGDLNSIEYRGPIFPLNPNNAPFPPAVIPSNSELDVLGTKAIARVSPSNPNADLSTFVAELHREGIPRIQGARTGRWERKTKEALKVPAEDYLAVQFGWKPVVNEVLSVANAISEKDAVIKQYLRDSGKLVRRRYDFPTEISETVTEVAVDATPYIPGGAGGLLDKVDLSRGRVVKVRRTEIHRWFSGGFTYCVPTGYSTRESIQRQVILAKKTLGITITPEVLWNLLPWSWAVDWFTDVGDVMSNLSAYIIDGLVLRYGYVMQHSVVTDTYTFLGPTGLRTKSLRPNPLIKVTETKVRRPATPYGFGKDWSGFSAFQLSILAALGISKKR